MTNNTAIAGQVSKTAAEIYDEYFVPALFGDWAGPICDAANIKPGDKVLDVACGSGATTREVMLRIGPNGRVTGLDRNEGMLCVARSRAQEIEWIEGRAESLPFADATFDVILCQFGLMFFDDRVRALQEMQRVLHPGGQLAVSVWDKVENSPGYARMIALIALMFGQEAADALRAPFVLGDKNTLQEVLTAGGLCDARIISNTGTARFSSIREWVRLDVYGWTLSELIDDKGFKQLVEAAENELSDLVGPDGTVNFPAPAHIAVWTPR